MGGVHQRRVGLGLWAPVRNRLGEAGPAPSWAGGFQCRKVSDAGVDTGLLRCAITARAASLDATGTVSTISPFAIVTTR